MLFPESRVQVDVLVYIVCHVGVELCEGHCLMLFLALSHQKRHLLPWHRYRRVCGVSRLTLVDFMLSRPNSYSLVNYDNLTLSKSAELFKRF